MRTLPFSELTPNAVLTHSRRSILHDPEVFEDPLEYKPERFLKDGKLNPEVLDPSVASFGYGRRICPGRFFANNSLFSIIAHVLSVYDIKPGLDENGNEVKITPGMSTGLLSYVPHVHAYWTF